MVRRALAFAVVVCIAFIAAACGAPGEKESSTTPIPVGRAPASTTAPDKATAGTPGELPPPPGFKKK